MNLRQFSTLFYGAAVFLLAACPAPAAAPERFTVSHTLGAAKVHMLSEKQSLGKSELISGLPAEQVQQLLPDGTYPAAFASFVVQIQGKNILVDAGMSETALPERLQAIGLAPEAIDTVLVTHMHMDHIGGLMREGKAVFPKATIYIAAQEQAYWQSDKAMNAVNEKRKANFIQARKVLEAYAPTLHAFKPLTLAEGPQELLPGVKAVAAFGHTPGHSMFMVESEGKRFLIWGDLTHAMVVQMPHPEATMVFDIDPAAAAASRKSVLEYAAGEGLAVGGMHVPFPGMGTMKKAAQGYSFTPLP